MKTLFLSFMIGLSNLAYCQNIYFTDKGQISFFSTTPIENISAVNNKVYSMINLETKDIVFSLKMSDFKFENQLMKEHFLENYVEASIYPKANYKGVFLSSLNPDSCKTSKPCKIETQGELTIHGVSQMQKTTTNLYFEKNEWIAKTEFWVKLEDFKVKVPQLLWEKLSEKIKVIVDMKYRIYIKN